MYEQCVAVNNNIEGDASHLRVCIFAMYNVYIEESVKLILIHVKRDADSHALGTCLVKFLYSNKIRKGHH